jgi:hypothetical protein
MKKVLVTVAALGLVFGMVATASALDTPSRATAVEPDTTPRVPTATAPGVALWSVSGQWVLAGAYVSDALGAGIADTSGVENNSSDDFYIYSFKILPVLQVNDKIAVKGELRFADRDVFGLTDTAFSSGFANDPGGRQIDTYHLYMEWMSPIGKTRFGRTPCGAWGTQFADNSSQCNRLMLWGNWMPENWGMLLFTQKTKEQDATNASSDGDNDAYYIDLSYKADFGKTTTALYLQRDATPGFGSGGEFTRAKFWLTGNYTWDAIGLEYEVDYNFGECAVKNCDEKNLGLYADLGYKTGDFTFGIKGIYASGDDDSDNKDESFMGANGLGKDFNPQQLMTGDYNLILNGDNPLTGTGIRSDVQQAGVGAGILYVQYKASPKLTLHADAGTYSALDEAKGYNDSYGQEYGVGFSYQLYDNLTYGAHFSYMKTGDFFEVGLAWDEYEDEYYYTDNCDTEDIYLIAHALSMKF